MSIEEYGKHLPPEDKERFAKFLDGLAGLNLHIETVAEGRTWFLKAQDESVICQLAYHDDKPFLDRFSFVAYRQQQ